MDTSNLQRREFIISENDLISGDLSLISMIVLDEQPAIGQGFQAFSNNKYIFAQTSSEKKLIIGPAMRPNIDMLRQDPKTGEYFMGYFTEEQVRISSEVFMRNSNLNATNLNHGELAGKNEIQGVTMVQSWIVEDPNNDKANALGFKEVQKGDWYVAFKIQNDEFWSFLKEHGNGFSIEGIFASRAIESFSAIKSDEDKIKEIIFDNTKSDNQKEKEILNIINKK